MVSTAKLAACSSNISCTIEVAFFCSSLKQHGQSSCKSTDCLHYLFIVVMLYLAIPM